MKSSWCGFSGLGVTVSVQKDTVMCPGQFYDPHCTALPKKEVYRLPQLFILCLFNAKSSQRKKGWFALSLSNKITTSIFSSMAG